MAKTFITTCVDCEDGAALEEMVEKSRDITRNTFMKHVSKGERQSFEKGLGYALHPRAGLTMKKDWHVKYAKSKFQGKPCVFVVWSAIEHIFC